MTDIRVDAPIDVPFLVQRTQTRVVGSMGVSLFIQAACVAVFVFLANRPPQASTAVPQEILNKDIVWLDMAGPGGGGGGGGNHSVAPPQKAELEGKEKITVPAVKPSSVELKKDEPPPPVQEVNIPAETLASANLALPGALEGAPPSSSMGSGSGTGAGTGSGSGIGSGMGSGLGPGSGGGTGGGVFQPGNGVLTPVLLREVKPQYTAQAMRAKIQGTVLLECVVAPDGTVGNIKVVRSLDSSFGLDQEAVKALRGWQFKPGTRMGAPVAVLVTVEIAFTLR